MSNLNLVNLIPVFNKIESEEYAIIKFNKAFPEYISGSDIDIFCSDQIKTSKLILGELNNCADKGAVIEVHQKQALEQIKIDVLWNNKINFRFDLYGTLPKYNFVHIKRSLFQGILDRRKKIDIGDSSSIYVASDIDEILLRYVEYLEWYDRRPDKIKHLEYILSEIEDDSQKRKFISLLHLYTKLPDTDPATFFSNSHLFNRYCKPLIYSIKKAYKLGFFGTIKKLLKHSH